MATNVQIYSRGLRYTKEKPEISPQSNALRRASDWLVMGDFTNSVQRPLFEADNWASDSMEKHKDAVFLRSNGVKALPELYPVVLRGPCGAMNGSGVPCLQVCNPDFYVISLASPKDSVFLIQSQSNLHYMILVILPYLSGTLIPSVAK